VPVATEQSLSDLRVRSGPNQLARLLEWATAFPERTWAIENATGLGYLLAQQLVAAGERVVDVQPKLAARVRVLVTESTNKNDPHDALSVAIAALLTPTEVHADDHVAVMKLWSKRQQDLSRQRTQIACQLLAVLCELVAGGVPDEIYPAKAVALLADVEAESAIVAARVELAEELIADLRRRDDQIKASRKRLAEVVAASSTTVTKIFGVGPVVAATVVGITGDIARFPTRQGGVAGVEATHQRHDLHGDGRRRPRRQHASKGGSGRATGERLCRQRGRLTPRDTGSSAQPLPDPNEGYDHDTAAIALDNPIEARHRDENSLTNERTKRTRSVVSSLVIGTTNGRMTRWQKCTQTRR
jgi:transposase